MAKIERNKIEEELSAANSALIKYPRGLMGLTPDAIRATPEWQHEKRHAEAAFKKLQRFNISFLKTYKKEIQSERNLRHAAWKL